MEITEAMLKKLKFLAGRELLTEGGELEDEPEDFYASGFFENNACDVFEPAVEHGKIELARELLAMIEVPSD